MTTFLIRQSNDLVGMAYSTIESAKYLGTNREPSFVRGTIKKAALHVNEILRLASGFNFFEADKLIGTASSSVSPLP
jgi:hypothetical protein